MGQAPWSEAGAIVDHPDPVGSAPMSLNYGVTLVGFLTPVMLLAYFKVIGPTTAIVLAGVGAILFPALFYRSSRSWWLMNYYIFLPHHLPANGGKGRAGEDDNV